MTDPLTGLPNRRAFQARLIEETDRVRRYGGHFSVILIDPDEFVTINEDLGHPTGDLIITWVGRILSEHTRASDLPFRFGRDKFMVLCPLTDGAVVQAVAGRLSAIIGRGQTADRRQRDDYRLLLMCDVSRRRGGPGLPLPHRARSSSTHFARPDLVEPARQSIQGLEKIGLPDPARGEAGRHRVASFASAHS